jgi:hypothetical protein
MRDNKSQRVVSSRVFTGDSSIGFGVHLAFHAQTHHLRHGLVNAGNDTRQGSAYHRNPISLTIFEGTQFRLAKIRYSQKALVRNVLAGSSRQ